MLSRSRIALLAALVCAPASAQQARPAPAPCTVAPQPVPCTAAPAKKPTTDAFPFPGEEAPKATAPDAQSPAAPTVKPAEKFPFPGDTAPDAPAAPGQGSSSSSSSSEQPDPAPDPPAAAKNPDDQAAQGMPGRHILRRVNPKGTKLQSDDEREAEDLDIAHYYTQTGNHQGAYMRAEDAAKTAPDDPDAHFALAEAAERLGKNQQAITEYTISLKLDPTDKKAAAARKALAILTAAK
jgi:tetratricopeptide (TPR) repeat protein